MNSNKYTNKYFCYFCGKDHYGNFISSCTHYICKLCYLNGNCLLCNNKYFKEQCEKSKSDNQLTTKKRKFKDIGLILELNENNYFSDHNQRISLRMNRILDEMINDFELLDYSLLNKEIKQTNCDDTFNQIVKRRKLY